MSWNWQLPDWPQFTYDERLIVKKEQTFLLKAGIAFATLRNLEEETFSQYAVDILSSEGLESSKIEGEILNRESLQSSIKKHFGLKIEKESRKEANVAKILCSVYETFNLPLSHQMLYDWHSQLFDQEGAIEEKGCYRTHLEPMQIVSHRYDAPKVFFEAPPSERVFFEMNGFISWFNETRPSIPILTRAVLAHLYFESIHPFEDGNGRLGRVLVEKILSQGVSHPILIAVSKVLEMKKKAYYAALERCNRTLEVNHWLEFFSEAILQAQEESLSALNFLIAKSKLLNRLASQLNPRQEKVLLRMFQEGPSGFKGGLSAENYISITKTSRASATRDLIDLVEKGALTKTGELRHTRYFLKLSD